jgi:hypothetical protein
MLESMHDHFMENVESRGCEPEEAHCLQKWPPMSSCGREGCTTPTRPKYLLAFLD